MKATDPLTGSTESGQPESRITATLVQEGGKPLFRLAYRGEAVALSDSHCLNRWMALGITEHHHLSLASDGIFIDVHKLLYADPLACQELERIVNRPPAVSHPHGPSFHSPSAQDVTHPAATETNVAVTVAESVKVTREGFEFHVTFRTRFGENKTEKLEAALETFQKMRVFKPHINLQKSGIRLVVTRWDGESFVEEPGIDNVEHASPEDVEALIRSQLQGQGLPAPGADGLPPKKASRPRVFRIEVVKKSHEPRFHLVLHRQDGTAEEGPLLIRANLPKLAALNLFRPDVSLSMTALNDRLVVDRILPGKQEKHAEALPLLSGDDAKRAEVLLNECLRTSELPDADRRESRSSPIEKPKAPVSSPLASVVPESQEKPLASSSPTALNAMGADAAIPVSSRLTELPPPPEKEPALTRPDAVPAGDRLPEDKRCAIETVRELLRIAEGMSPEQINSEVFPALRARFEAVPRENDHGCPAFTIEIPGEDKPPTTLELVLTPHCLLGNFDFGYLRFGLDTRVFLNRLSDYLAYPEDALRGVVGALTKPHLRFVISDSFASFLRNQSDRAYWKQFGPFLLAASEVAPEENLIWPLSQEERLFLLVARGAAIFGFPTTPEAIVLDPSGPGFIGFRLVPPHGMEFRDGEKFFRIMPLGCELKEPGTIFQCSAKGGISGWALDKNGRVCVLYRTGSGLEPPSMADLVRFLPDEDPAGQEEGLIVLGHLPS